MTMILATPDFGASYHAMQALRVILACFLVLVIVGIAGGIALLRKKGLKVRMFGFLLVLAAWIAPLYCFLLAPDLIRFACGIDPPSKKILDHKIKEGMDRDEVSAILGSPNERYEGNSHGGESWYYHRDTLGLQYVAIDFGPGGRVAGKHFN